MAAPAQAALQPATLSPAPLLPLRPAFGVAPQLPAAPPTGPPTGPPTVKLSGGDGLSATLALRQWLTRTDPKYQNSFGDLAFERSTSSGLKLTGWRPIDHAQQVWSKLEGPLSSLVSEKRLYWEARRPRRTTDGTESGSTVPMYALRCFLIGPDRSHATPHVAVLSNLAWFRKGIGSIFTKSGLLVADGFKCCGLPDMPQLYKAPGDAMQHADPKHLGTLGEFKIVLPPNYTNANGMKIEILHNDTIVSHATVGGVIEIGSYHLGMTVRHAFQALGEAEPEPEEFSKDLDCEIDIFEEEDDDDSTELDELLFVDDSTPAQYDSELQETPTDGSTGLELVPTSMELTLDRQERSPLTGLGAKLDWALILLRPDAQNEHFVRPSRESPSNRIALKTSSLLKYGTVDSSGILGVPMLAIPQPVLVVALGGVQPGDCGAWAVKVIDGSFVGMLIGSCDTLGELYLLRMSDIIDDITQQTGVVADIKAVPLPPTPVLPNTGISMGAPLGAGVFYPQDGYYWEPWHRPPSMPLHQHEVERFTREQLSNWTVGPAPRPSPHSETSSMDVLIGEEYTPPSMSLLTGEDRLPLESLSMDLVISGLTSQTPSEIGTAPRFGVSESGEAIMAGRARMGKILFETLQSLERSSP